MRPWLAALILEAFPFVMIGAIVWLHEGFSRPVSEAEGRARLIALRAYVASKLGDEVDLP